MGFNDHLVQFGLKTRATIEGIQAETAVTPIVANLSFTNLSNKKSLNQLTHYLLWPSKGNLLFDNLCM